MYPPPQQNTYSVVRVAPPPQQQNTPPLAELPPELPPEFSAPLPAPVSAPATGAKLIPSIYPSPDKNYKLQVGSFKIARNAVDTYVILQRAGLNPEYERNEEYYRVVLKGIRGTEVQSVTEKLGQAGFREAFIKEE
jgi:rare lipoprotein A